MKAIWKIEYDPEEHYDKVYMNRVIHAIDAYGALYDMGEYLKTRIKNPKTEEEEDMLEKVLSKFIEILEENNINLDRDYS